MAARVDPDSHPPAPLYTPDELVEIREKHPLAAVLTLLRSTLVSIADEALHVMIVTDAQGNILWREGSPVVRRAADPVGLFEGTRWSETSMGTNAMGTTLAVDAPVQVHSAEHLVHTYPDGLTAEQLALYLTARTATRPQSARIHRLRARLGDVVHTKPYRLRAELDIDLHAVRAALRSGQLDTATRLCTGVLLPQSESPTLRAEWDELLVALRQAVLNRARSDPLEGWVPAQSQPNLHNRSTCGSVAT